MINLCLVVIATQFSETKRRETERMIAERRRFSRSSSTLLSTSDSDPGSCWEEMIKLIGHLFRRAHRKILKKYAQIKKKKSNVSLRVSLANLIDESVTAANALTALTVLT